VRFGAPGRFKGQMPPRKRRKERVLEKGKGGCEERRAGEGAPAEARVYVVDPPLS
jgi:hypothetical protein